MIAFRLPIAKESMLLLSLKSHEMLWLQFLLSLLQIHIVNIRWYIFLKDTTDYVTSSKLS